MAQFNENSRYSFECPVFKDGSWTASVLIKEIHSGMLQGATEEDVREQILHFLGQQALEIEKARVSLRRKFEHQSESV